MIRLGTIAAIGFEDFDPPQWLPCFRRLGCQVVQAYRNAAKDIGVNEMRDAIAAGGMPCDSLHAIFGEPYDPSSPDERARAFAIDTYRREGELCRQLGGRLVVVHCSTIRQGGVPPAERTARVAALKRSIDELGRFGQALGVTYAFENLPAYHVIGSDVAELAGILTSVGAPCTGMCFDTGHANMVGGDPARLVRRTDGTLVYVHVSDNDGQSDGHEMITCGSIDADALARALREIGYDGTFMLEVFYPLDRLCQLIDEGLAGKLERLLRLANGQP